MIAWIGTISVMRNFMYQATVNVASTGIWLRDPVP